MHESKLMLVFFVGEVEEVEGEVVQAHAHAAVEPVLVSIVRYTTANTITITTITTITIII